MIGEAHPHGEREPLQRTVSLILNGGTISSIATDNGRVATRADLTQILYREEKPPVDLVGIVFGYDGLSENMTLDDQTKLLAVVRSQLFEGKMPDALVVTHGTDTLLQSATMLCCELGKELAANGKVVILTGSNKGLDEPDSDAFGNFDGALRAAAGASLEPGVYVFFGGQTIAADKAVRPPYDPKGPSFMAVDDPKLIGRIADHFIKNINPVFDHLDRLPAAEDPLGDSGVVLYRANEIRGDHDDFLRQIECSKPRVVLLELYHSGTANTTCPRSSVSNLVAELTRRGIIVFGGTENDEPTDLSRYATSRALRDAGVIPLFDIPLNAALRKLRATSSKLEDHEIIMAVFSYPFWQASSLN